MLYCIGTCNAIQSLFPGNFVCKITAEYKQGKLHDVCKKPMRKGRRTTYGYQKAKDNSPCKVFSFLNANVENNSMIGNTLIEKNACPMYMGIWDKISDTISAALLCNNQVMPFYLFFLRSADF